MLLAAERISKSRLVDSNRWEVYNIPVPRYEAVFTTAISAQLTGFGEPFEGYIGEAAGSTPRNQRLNMSDYALGLEEQLQGYICNYPRPILGLFAQNHISIVTLVIQPNAIRFRTYQSNNGSSQGSDHLDLTPYFVCTSDSLKVIRISSPHYMHFFLKLRLR